MVNLQEFKKELGSKIFSATFIKKNGEIRKLHCMLKVTKYLKGGEKKYNTDSLNYITVYDLKNKGYRTLNLNTIIEIKYNGKVIKNN